MSIFRQFTVYIFFTAFYIFKMFLFFCRLQYECNHGCNMNVFSGLQPHASVWAFLQKKISHYHTKHSFQLLKKAFLTKTALYASSLLKKDESSRFELEHSGKEETKHVLRYKEKSPDIKITLAINLPNAKIREENLEAITSGTERHQNSFRFQDHVAVYADSYIFLTIVINMIAAI